jgi:hypothetical protein
MNNSKKVAGLAGLASVLWMGFTAAVAASQKRLLFNPLGSKREVLKPYSSGIAPVLLWCGPRTARAWPAG